MSRRRLALAVGLALVLGLGASPGAADAWGPPPTDPTPASTAPARLQAAGDSVPETGWFHVTGFTLPTGSTLIRYSNVDRPVQTGLAEHGAGPLSFWFRAPGPRGSKVTVRLEVLDAAGDLLANLGIITLITGNAMLPLPPSSGSGRRMVIDSDAQQVWLVEDDGRVSDSFLMSGRRIHTASGFDQTGVFRVYSKSRWMRYCEDRCGRAGFMVRYQRTTRSAVGSHSLPYERGRAVQGVEDLGWPLSHGCARLEDTKAEAVYRWAAVGTIVIVF